MTQNLIPIFTLNLLEQTFLSLLAASSQSSIAHIQVVVKMAEEDL